MITFEEKWVELRKTAKKRGPRRRKGGPGWVYGYKFASKQGLIKIGFTRQHPKNRIKQLSTGFPEKPILVFYLKSLKPRKLEQLLHERFQKFNGSAGIEWFEYTPQQVDIALDWARARELEKAGLLG